MEETRKERGQLAITVGICPRNRAAMLQTALDRVARVRVPDDVAWEILVVDNGSDDETPNVLEFRSRLPLRPLHLETPGKSHALNHATAHASGEYLLWTADDAFVDSEWVSASVAAFRRWPDASFFDGHVEPWFGAPPAWLANHDPSLGSRPGSDLRGEETQIIRQMLNTGHSRGPARFSDLAQKRLLPDLRGAVEPVN